MGPIHNKPCLQTAHRTFGVCLNSRGSNSRTFGDMAAVANDSGIIRVSTSFLNE